MPCVPVALGVPSLRRLVWLFGSVDASVEGLSRQWMDQTFRPHSPSSSSDELDEHNVWNPMLRLLYHAHDGVQALLDEVDLGRIALSCHFALGVLCDKAEVHRSEGNIIRYQLPLVRASVGLSGYTSLLRPLLGTRVRGQPALDKWRSRARSAARSFKYTASGTLAIKVAVQIGTIATIALALPEVICWASIAARGFLPSWWSQSPAEHSTWTAHYRPSYSYPFYLFHTVAFHRVSWWLSVP